MTTLPSSSRAGTASLEKRYRCRESRHEAGSAPPGSRCNSRAACAAAITEASSSRSSQRARRQIERDDRCFAQLVVGRGERIACQVDARRMVGEPAFGQLAGVSREQPREVRPGFAAVAQVLGVDGVEPQFFKRSGQGAGKAWKSGHRPEVGELSASERLGGDARSQRLPDEPAHRHEPPAVQLRGGQLQDQFAECEPAHAHQGLAASRQGDLFGRRADRRQNQHGARGGPLRDKLHGPAAQFEIRGHWSCWRWYRESLRWGMIERPALFP